MPVIQAHLSLSGLMGCSCCLKKPLLLKDFRAFRDLLRITEGKTSSKIILDGLILELGAIYIMDRGYIDFGRLYVFTQTPAFFVIRAKRNLNYSRRSYRHVDKSTGLRSDQTIILRGPKTSKLYPLPLRRITYFDEETHTRFVFLTNNFEWIKLHHILR